MPLKNAVELVVWAQSRHRYLKSCLRDMTLLLDWSCVQPSECGRSEVETACLTARAVALIVARATSERESPWGLRVLVPSASIASRSAEG
jgi:hypothetical protein